MNYTNLHPTEHLENAMAMSVFCAALMSIIMMVHLRAIPANVPVQPETDESDNHWKPIGSYGDETLYERIYPSGKKAWRFSHKNHWAYPRRSDLVSEGVLSVPQ